MAVPFYQHIDLKNNEVQNVRIHNTSAPPNEAEGQIYYDTSTNVLRYRNDTTWIDLVASTGGTVQSIASANASTITIGGTAVNPTISANTGPVGSGNLTLVTGDAVHTFVTGQGYVESVGTTGTTFVNVTNTGTAKDPVVTASLTATGSPNSGTYLRGDNTWAAISDIDTTYNLETLQVGNDVDMSLVGSDASLSNVLFVAGTNITLTRTAPGGDEQIEISSPNQTKTVTLTGDVTGSASGTDTITVAASISSNAVTLSKLDNGLVVTSGEGISNNNNNSTLPTSAAVKAYVDSSTVGSLIYQGAYNASTNSPDLTTAPNSIQKGWTYTVTVAGTFLGEAVDVGDVLIAEVDNPDAIGDWTTVQKNIDVASATTPGIGNVVAGSGVTVSYNTQGTATVSTIAAPVTTGSIQVNTSGTYTYPNSITADNVHDVMIQLVDTTSGETVFADVTRLTTTTFSVAYAGAGPFTVKALISKI